METITNFNLPYHCVYVLVSFSLFIIFRFIWKNIHKQYKKFLIFKESWSDNKSIVDDKHSTITNLDYHFDNLVKHQFEFYTNMVVVFSCIKNICFYIFMFMFSYILFHNFLSLDIFWTFVLSFIITIAYCFYDSE